MISIKQWMETCNYQITEGSVYQWNCFGSNAYALDSWNGDNDTGWTLSITFDTKDQEVYVVEVHDYKNSRCYRIINPEYLDAFKHECEARNIGFNEAGDEYNYIDLEADEDWLEKAVAIIEGRDYDTRVSIPVDFSDEELLEFMKAAHEKDMTFNQYIEYALRSLIDNLKSQGKLEGKL